MVFTFHQGTAPIVISVPHAGLNVPNDIKARLSEEGLRLTDTDWHVDRLYAPLKSLGVSMLVATHSRYVIDLNRPADGSSLYPGQTVTQLCPTKTFEGLTLYKDGEEPGEAEIKERTTKYWQPYHTKLAEELARIKEAHGHALLWDAHSINNHLPLLFDGQLPDLNFGTNDGKASNEGLAKDILAIAKADTRYSSVLNGRFKGGIITRSFGKPEESISAIQLEMAQSCYMDQETFEYREGKAETVQGLLHKIFKTILHRQREK
jgi:N-formylglutamate deformylase